ncbi:hypothetical protein LSTR_LSTR011415 [Laodelphax striatellus]|uniref:TRASH domain-containing protein n=1 Tax=Laodelphax striatellus TaxID=195883 RepID=A0A482WP08_LAOST|nr:hypothetical protein LSTR_LSTR011415 [Laodelphax striatellus]
MENDQKDGSTLFAATTNSISASNLKTVDTPVTSKSVDGEVNQNSVANCNKSISLGSASDVPVTLSASETEKEDEVLVNDKTSLNVSNSEINDKQSVSDVVVDKSVTDDKPLPDSLDNSLKDDSVLSEGSSRMEQTLVNDKSAQESEGKDVVDESTPKSDSLPEIRQICNKTIQEDEAMDVDESLTISNDNESASKDSTSQVVEASNEKCELIDSNPASDSSVGVSEGKKVAENGSKKLRSILEDSKDQDDSNQMLGLDECSTNLSETSAKFEIHDCDEDLSQDDVREVASIDPFAQTGEESMEVEEVEDMGKKNSEESGVKKKGDESEEEKKEGDESKEKKDNDGAEEKLDDEPENSVESVDKDEEKVKGKEDSDNNEKEMGSVRNDSEEKKDSKEVGDKSGDEEIGDKTAEKVADEENVVDEAMEVDGKQVTAKETMEVVGKEKEGEEERSKEVVETDKIEDVNNSDKDTTEKESENSSGKHVTDKKGENSSGEVVVEDDDDDCVLVVEDGEKGSEECSVQKKGDDGEVSKDGEKDVEIEEGEKNKDDETSLGKGGDCTSDEVAASSGGGVKPSAGGDGVDSATSDKVADSSSDKPSSTSSDDVTKKNVESSKEATKDKGGAEIEIDEDICIIPDTVRLPPDQGNVSNSGTATPTPSTAASTSSTPSGSGGKVLNEVSSLTNRIKVVKMEMEVKQETPTSSRPKRQAATKADAQIKATVKEFDLYNEEEGEKENEEEVDENIQLCKQCAKVKPCKFNILNKNKVVSHLCSEECAIAYKNSLLAADKARGVGAAVAEGASGGGNVHINEAGEFVRSCSQCRNQLTMGESVLSWETMDFCNEDCLGKYQTCLGSHCAYCKKGVQQTSLGKYCVRFGYHIRQFCSSTCLEEYKRGLKVCSFCQKDISSSESGFLAPVGDKGTFKDFCTQHCMEQYDRLSNNQPAPAEMHSCDVCNENKVVGVQVLVDSKLSKLCSEVCFAAFKFVNEVTVDQCDMCHKYFDRNTLRSDNLTVYYDDNQHNFCCKTCMNAYILGKRKIVPCNWCKVKKYNFDMIKRVLETGQTLMMCSLNCLTLYKVSINAVSSRRIKCDNCNSVSQAQYHLTMSDATIRNFCTYPCVMNFQGQYSKNPITLPGGQQTPIPTGGPKRAIISGVTSPKDIRPSVPIISSVTSLATTNGQPATSLLQSPTVVNSLSSVVSSVSSNATMAKSPVQSVGTVSGGTVTASTATAMKNTCNNYVIIREKNPPKMANKCTSFRPTTHTKGVSCRPHSCSQEIQTDVSGGDGKTVIVPIPVPVYIPVPVHMYSMPTPVPIPFPVPVPVPIFIPTTRNSAKGIMDEIKRIHEKIPTDPFEAELLMMAQAVAEKKDDSGGSAAPSGGAASPDRSVSPAEDVASEVDGDEGESLPVSCELATPSGVDLDAELTPTTITVQKRRPAAASVVSENDEDVDDPDPVETPPTKRKRGRPSVRGGWTGGGSAKRGRRSTSNISSSNHLTACTPTSTNATSAPLLKFMLGVQAYKQWIQNRNASADTAESSPKRPKQLKADLLQQTPEELNYSLTLFVREARKPSGDPYPPDTSFYFCLGIQYYLFNNGRTENIFTDSYFDTFTDALQEVVQHFPAALRETPVIVTRVEEEHLWESRQLGAHSPNVLLCTLMFFNTKYFNLVTVEDHMKLSFSHIMKHWKKGGSTAPVTGTRNVLLRYYPSGSDSAKRSSTGKRLTYEQHENEDDPLRCPVKLYEFYLSKCPESVKSRGELFYLQPERSCVPDSPVWYSTQSISEEALSKVLNRITMVKEINLAVVNA